MNFNKVYKSHDNWNMFTKVRARTDDQIHNEFAPVWKFVKLTLLISLRKVGTSMHQIKKLFILENTFTCK